MFFASFDVKALYPSIPILLACSLLRKLLLELPDCYSPVDVPLIVELVRAVLTTNIVNFKGDLFLQTLGGAMGSSCFPSIAIIFLYMTERSLVRSVLGSSCLVFKRYLDDMFAVFTSKAAAMSFFTRYNALVQGIDTVCVTTESTQEKGGINSKHCITACIVEEKIDYYTIALSFRAPNNFTCRPESVDYNAKSHRHKHIIGNFINVANET